MRIIITGANSGLGLASAEAFAKEGHNILMLARGEQRLNQAAEELKSKYPLAAIEAQKLDVSDFDQVRDFANKQTKTIDVLMNNAGLMGPDFKLSPQGIESQMATNHLGHFLLTNLLTFSDFQRNPRKPTFPAKDGEIRQMDPERFLFSLAANCDCNPRDHSFHY